MRRRLKALVPDEAMPQGETLRVSDDKAFCMSEMRNSMRKTMDESAWPEAQYLWKLHPILSWANDKAGLLFKRDEAPVIGLPGKLQDDEAIYIVSGSMPNRKSTPLIDVWFGLLYQGGEYKETLPMTEVVRRSGISNMKIPNTNCITETALTKASALREDVVKQARKVMDEHYRQYQAQMTPKLDEEIEKLASLQEQHKEYQLSLFESERKKSEAERRVDELFDRFADWVKDTLEIQNNPYIRIESVLMGAKQ